MHNKMINPEEAFSLALTVIQRQYPLFGYIIHQLERVFITDNIIVDTMGVGKTSNSMRIKLYINIHFLNNIINSYSVQNNYIVVIAEVIKHEIYHIIFGHLEYKFSDSKRKNWAADMSVNSHLNKNLLPNFTCVDEDGNKLQMKPIDPIDYGFPERLSLIEYYNLLKDNNDIQKIGNHENWSNQSDASSDGGSTSSLFIKDIIKKAKTYNNNSWGKLPFDELVDVLEDIIKDEKPKIPWQKVIRNFHTSCFSDEIYFTNKRVSKRYGCRPGLKIKEQCRILIGIDTSGSILIEHIKMFLNELPHINKESNTFDIVECDCQIQRIYKYKQLDAKVKGRGGTDLKPVLDYCEKEKYDGLIYFTDFEAPLITKTYKFPILWIINNINIIPESFPYKKGIFIQQKTTDTFEKIYPKFS